MKYNQKYNKSKEEIQEAVDKSLSIAQVCRELNIVPKGGNYKTLKQKFKEFEIDISHFTGQGWNVGLKYKNFGRVAKLEDILIEDSKYTNSNSLKKKLIKEGFKEHKCEKCNLSEWMYKPISIELNHINGNNTDNRIGNLEILCPNCHAITDNYRGKNIKSYRTEMLKEQYDSRNDLEKVEKNIKKGRIYTSRNTTHKCLNCENEIRLTQQKYCSRKCYNNFNRSNIPNVPALIKSFEEIGTYLGVGEKYGVSDNAVKKWVVSYGIEKMINLKYNTNKEAPVG